MWQRRQPPPQQTTIEPAPIKGIKRINTVVVREQGQGQGTKALRRDPYAIEVDQGRNCYAYRGFGHMAHHCKNKERGRLMKGRRIKYSRGRIEEIYNNMNNLKGVENLELLN